MLATEAYKVWAAHRNSCTRCDSFARGVSGADGRCVPMCEAGRAVRTTWENLMDKEYKARA